MTSSPPRPLSVSRSLAGSGKKMLTAACRPKTVTPPASPAAPNTSAPLVPLTVTVSAAPSPPPFGPRRSRSIRVTSVPLRSPTTMLSAPPSARKSMRLDVVEVHRHVGDVAEEQHAAAVGDDVDVLAGVRAEEQHRVGAVLALDRCRCRRPGPTGRRRRRRPCRATSLPLSPKMKSLPSPPRNTSAPWLPRSVSLPAPPSSVSLMTPAGSVVAVTPSLPPRALMTSASLAPSELVMFTCAGRPEHRDRGAGAEDVDDVVAVGAVDDHGVGRGVAGRAADRAGEVDVDLASGRCRSGR